MWASSGNINKPIRCTFRGATSSSAKGPINQYSKWRLFANQARRGTFSKWDLFYHYATITLSLVHLCHVTNRRKFSKTHIFPPKTSQLSQATILSMRIPRRMYRYQERQPITFIKEQPTYGTIQACRTRVPIKQVTTILRHTREKCITNQATPQARVFCQQSHRGNSLLLSITRYPSKRCLIKSNRMQLYNGYKRGNKTCKV